MELCDGISRRELLRIGGLGAAGLMLPELLRAQPTVGPGKFGRAKRVIVLFMSGGPPQQDTWDLKPEASGSARGEFRPIKTNVSGIEISEQFPLLARQADKYAIIRSVTHGPGTRGVHTLGTHAMLTGNAHPTGDQELSAEIWASPTDFPHYGSTLSYLRKSDPRVPSFVALPMKQSSGDLTVWPGQGGGFLGARNDPLQVTADFKKHRMNPADYENCVFRAPSLTLPDGVTADRLNARRRLLKSLEGVARGTERDAAAGLLDHFREKAFDLLSSTETQKAFNLDAEPAAVRDRYGRHLFGQGCLLARRLAQAGVPLVTVYWHQDGNGSTAVAWDTHSSHYQHLKTLLMPPCDRGFSALLEDLDRTGMLADTLVIWMGEFGRTHQINPAGGRDHWPPCQSIVMAGAGIRGGQVYGASDKNAAYPIENPVSPGDVGATIYWLLGIRPDVEIVDQGGRPHPLVRGEPLMGLM